MGYILGVMILACIGVIGYVASIVIKDSKKNKNKSKGRARR